MANILIIEDDADTAETLATLLKLVGHDPQVARDGFQAIEMARRQPPNYVLLDLGLPGLDGYQVISRLRRELAESTPVIAITGYGQEEHRRRALAAGFDHYFIKPIDHSILLTLLSQSSIEPTSPEHTGGSPVATRPGVCPTRVVTRSVEITNALGLHLRAADKFVRVAQQFQAKVTVACDGHTANGRSILDLATLAAGCGTRLALEGDGPDAEAAIGALADLIERGFDELGPQPGSVAMADPPGGRINGGLGE